MSFVTDTQDVLDHLMFHKAFIEDDTPANRDTRLEKYIGMVNEIGKGTLVSSEDPCEKSIALVFELVVQQKLNPWDINLIEFSKMYLSRVKKASELNLIVAGKLVYMAWEILKLQTEQLLQRVDRPEHVEMMFEGWDPDNLDIFVDPFDMGSGEVLLHTEDNPIQEKVRRRGERPVTLIDLLDAFEEAKKRGPMTIARTCTFRDATGAVQDAYDSVTTESVTVHAEMSGDLSREDWTASVSGVRDFVVTGLAGAETSITWNGTGSETMTRVRELADGEEHRFDMTGTEIVSDVVIPVPRRPAGWPLSGTIARHVTVTLTGGPRDGEAHERDVTITFDGTQFATVTVNGETFTMDLARRQHAGRPHRGPGHGPGPAF